MNPEPGEKLNQQKILCGKIWFIHSFSSNMVQDTVKTDTNSHHINIIAVK